MIESDIETFAKLLSEVWALWPNAKPLNSAQGTMFFRALSSYSIENVASGFDGHVKDPARGRFPPTPADVIAQIEARSGGDGRPGADEAWAVAITAADEGDTVVWTAEMAEAWSTAKPVFVSGDEIGARLAFRDSYNRFVALARAKRMPPVRWNVSLGFDTQRRDVALERAERLGVISQTEVLAITGPAARGEPLLLAATPVTGMPDHVRESLDRLRKMLVEKTHAPGMDAAEKARTRKLKAEAASKVEFYEKGGSDEL
jgi:hypothetical protein